MNFLAHYLIATEYLPPARPLTFYAVGTALPDLLPLASAHIRKTTLVHAPRATVDERALLAGVTSHLETDAAFHKTTAFQAAQTAVSDLVAQAGFSGMRVRRFFVAHILTELALDAVLLRRTPSLADRFYAAFSPAEIDAASQWAEATLKRPLPNLADVLSRFAHSRYLIDYATDAGVAEGLNHLCARARQDTFEGTNAQRLVRLVTDLVETISPVTGFLLAETADAVLHN